MKYTLAFSLILFSIVCHSQLVTDSVSIGNHFRTFSYYKPGNVKNGSLLFMMHGSGGTNTDMLQRTKNLEAMAAKDHLLVVYPNGYQHYWNECRKFSTAVANKENIDEGGFFNAMIKYFQSKYGIDQQKVFAAGFSGGGHMAYKLAMTMPAQVKAIAAIVANMPDSASCDCAMAGKALPVLIINGTDDKTNPYNGGEMFINNASFGVVRSTENTFGYWSKLAGYTGAPVQEQLPDTDTSDHKIIERYSFSEINKPPVTLLKVIGGHHDYPNDIDVYVYVWEFFKKLI